MNKDRFNLEIMDYFTIEEMSNINPRIYLNKDHIDYYMNYHLERYEWCLNYLKKNRNLLK